ncbi:hypothetical protein BGX26_000285 [Mortierella sp. AD094]|nr:hypothetical protein BGX26_000285 [Mortierella sp. AD094]
MVKYGFAVVQFVVPALAHLNISASIESVNSSLESSKDSIDALVDQMIAHLQKYSSSPLTDSDTNTDLDTNEFDFSKLEALEGADLRRLENYLTIKDHDRVLGNLYRDVTDEGHVKWVCIYHYRENYKEAATNHLKEVVEEENSGTYEKETGKIKIRLPSSSVAKRLYEALANARSTQELDIKLDWDVAPSDLQKLASAVSKANVIILKLNGKRFRVRARDLINRNQQFDPIIGLIGNRRTQSLQLESFDEFFTSISSTAVTSAPQLRILHINSPLDLENKASKVALTKILDSAPNLRLLHLKALKLHTLYEFTMGKFSKKLGAMYATWDEEPVLTLEFLRKESASATDAVVVSQKSYINSFRVMISTASDQIYLLSTLLSEYGWAIKELDIPQKLDDKFAQNLDSVTSAKGSRLWNLAFGTDLLSSKGVDSMVKVIDRSKMLECLGLTFYSLDDKTVLKKLEYLLQNHADKLSDLTLYINSPHLWMPEFTNGFSNDILFPNLSCLRLYGDGSLIPRTCVQWIASMLTSLTKPPVQSPPSEVFSQDMPSSSSSSASQDEPTPSQESPEEDSESAIGIRESRSSLKQFTLDNVQLESGDLANSDQGY